ncbi:uncharacterized protein EI90DRAFT_2600400 [Cantharellus anzutake]|uniref:uncharacterized protein n=1 Tax=Cantharellus anzutake TaxID=1750568 RepID=UPI0019089D3F|nr:uncharacterized protein EI90DRAFT_2600400 [Cantharellus anzutake]KAF8320545.1 hypothetical protein EI90DRAFT_2600400 [Cantharellus anzutake]
MFGNPAILLVPQLARKLRLYFLLTAISVVSSHWDLNRIAIHAEAFFFSYLILVDGSSMSFKVNAKGCPYCNNLETGRVDAQVSGCISVPSDGFDARTLVGKPLQSKPV